jgi:transcriptional regulator with XRE-family HTH domain
MHPFGETVLAWRLARGMTQSELARTARIPRPNLSAIERGDREVTLKTLRALALALDVRPGVLADGMPPDAGTRPLSRTRLERIARAAVRGTPPRDTREAVIANGLRNALSARIDLGRGQRRRRVPTGSNRSYFLLRTRENQATLASLVDRVGLELERT